MLLSQPIVEFYTEASFFTCHLHFSLSASWKDDTNIAWKEYRDRETGFSFLFPFVCSESPHRCKDSLIQIWAVGLNVYDTSAQIETACVGEKLGEHCNWTDLVVVTSAVC